jgi:hypothetical protein
LGVLSKFFLVKSVTLTFEALNVEAYEVHRLFLGRRWHGDETWARFESQPAWPFVFSQFSFRDFFAPRLL